MNSSSWTNVLLEQIIFSFVIEHPLNNLVDFEGVTIFQKPILGVADGDDPIFKEFLTAVSPRHIIPRKFLKKNCQGKADLSYVSVVSWALPFTEKVRRSNWSCHGPSRLYSLARNNGDALIHELSLHLQSILKKHGKVGISPIFTDEYDVFRSPEHIFTSSWSERHVAYAAGLGCFGLNGSLITPIGANVRFGSIITNLPLETTPRARGSYMAACLEYEGKDCDRCIERCPVDAISKHGIDKSKCYARKKAIEGQFMDNYVNSMKMFPHPIVKSGKRKEDYSLGCALCQTDVPCESESPESLIKGFSHA